MKKKLESEKADQINEKIKKVKEIQNQAVKYSKDFPYLLLTFATGVGKTLSAIKIAVSDILEQTEEEDKQWTIAVEETSSISSWNQEFKKHDLTSFRKYFEIITYASIRKNKNKRIILDECHHAISDFRISSLKSHKLEKIVALSATMDKFKKDKLNQLGVFKQYDYPLKKAIKEGILPTPEIKVHLIELENKERNLYFKINRGNKKDRFKIMCDYDTYVKNHSFTSKASEYHINCTPKEYYKLFCEEIDKAKKQYTMFKHKGLMFKWLNLASSRKRFIAEQKTNILADLIKEEKIKKRYIVFCGSIKQAKEVRQYENIIHSNQSQEKNQQVIDKFNKRRISSIFCVQKLREGINIYDLDFGIITQIDSGALSFIQMVGRALRSEKPLIHMIVIKKTKDQEYYEKIKKEIGEEFFTEIERKNK